MGHGPTSSDRAARPTRPRYAAAGVDARKGVEDRDDAVHVDHAIAVARRYIGNRAGLEVRESVERTNDVDSLRHCPRVPVERGLIDRELVLGARAIAAQDRLGGEHGAVEERPAEAGVRQA